MEETKTNWIDKMIERQATPEPIREGTVEDFCAEYGVSVSNYYYHASKPENQKHILETALSNAKKHAPEVLENLGKRAKENKQDAELYLKFILQLSDKLDITTGGLPINLDNDQLQRIARRISDGSTPSEE